MAIVTGFGDEGLFWVDAGILVIANINVHQRTAIRQAGDGRSETERPTSTGLRTAESGQDRTVEPKYKKPANAGLYASEFGHQESCAKRQVNDWSVDRAEIDVETSSILI